MPVTPKSLQPIEAITARIIILRGVKLMLDADLADLYGVQTKRFNERVKRNIERFPEDFMFQLSQDEFDHLRSQSATSNIGRGGRRYLPYVFTEHGALMVATILNSPYAIEVSVYVMRAFVQLRELLVSHKELAKRLDMLEQTTEARAMQHDAFARNTRAQLKQVFDAIRELMTPTAPTNKRSIGFVIPEDKK
jgi:hypothetical protein